MQVPQQKTHLEQKTASASGALIQSCHLGLPLAVSTEAMILGLYQDSAPPQEQ